MSDVELRRQNGFQSTPSARRATGKNHLRPSHRPISIHALREESDSRLWLSLTTRRYFNPRPPRGERLKYWCMESMPIWISIHALREESDTFTMDSPPFLFLFQSTPSARRATDVQLAPLVLLRISIHALREESDCLPARSSPRRCYFNPRPPRGERPDG